MPAKKARLAVQKTYKLFIGGKFVRGENGRVLAARDVAGQPNYCSASRKDFRDAVLAARGALAGWSKKSAYLRGQILYRAAEMLEMRGRDFARVLPFSAAAWREVAAATGWCITPAGRISSSKSPEP